MECTCQDWKDNINLLNAPLLLMSLRMGSKGYTGKFMVYCPWCASLLKEPKMEEKIIEVKNPKTGRTNLSEIVRERVEVEDEKHGKASD